MFCLHCHNEYDRETVKMVLVAGGVVPDFISYRCPFCGAVVGVGLPKGEPKEIDGRHIC